MLNIKPDFPGMRTGAVVAAHPLAVQAGSRILRQGGNAVDAAVAVSFALNVVEPQASGIGGGGFMLIYPAQGNPIFIDYREKAPAHCTEYCKLGGSAVAVPGQLRGMEKALEMGTKTLAQLTRPAAELARQGFRVTSVFSGLLEPRLSVLQRSSSMESIFLDKGSPPQPGFKLVQQDLAETLELIGECGADCFYTGPLAQEISAAVQEAGGTLSMEDLADYRVRVLQPLEMKFGQYSILTAPPPSTGGANLLQLLGIWENLGEGPALGQLSGIDYLARAMTYVFRDQDQYMGDPDHVQIPLDMLLGRNYLSSIAREVAQGRSAAGQKDHGSASTTNFVTADKEGNVVVVTQTINHFFGAGVAVPGRGIILNNQIADFSPASGSPNAPAPGKTPLSNMAPTIVVRDGRIVLALGSPGAKRIVTALGQVLLMYLEGGLNFREAVQFPRVHTEGGYLHMEGDTLKKRLEQLGHQVKPHKELDLYFGGVTGIAWEKDGPVGAFDPRRDGDLFLE